MHGRKLVNTFESINIMKLRFLLIPAVIATAVFAQDPDGFGGRRPFTGAPGSPDAAPAPQGPGGPGGPMMIMRPDRRWGRMGMRGWGTEAVEFRLGRLLSDPNVRQQLGITADQAAKIRQQESDFRKSEIRNRADLQIKRLDLDDLLSADKPDRAAIDRKLQEVGAAEIALEKSAIDNRLNMRDALTPAQRQKLEQMMIQRRQPLPGDSAPAAPGGPQGPGRGGRGPTPPPAPGQARPNQ